MSWKDREPDSIEESQTEAGVVRVEKYGRVSLLWTDGVLFGMTFPHHDEPDKWAAAEMPDDALVDAVLSECGFTQ